MTRNTLHSQMQQEMIVKEIFNQVKDYAFDYAHKAFERNVYPTDSAIEKLTIFDEQLPESIRIHAVPIWLDSARKEKFRRNDRFFSMGFQSRASPARDFFA